MRVRLIRKLFGAWEEWEYDIPDGMDFDDVAEQHLDNGVLVDSGHNSSEIDEIDEI